MIFLGNHSPYMRTARPQNSYNAGNIYVLVFISLREIVVLRWNEGNRKEIYLSFFKTLNFHSEYDNLFLCAIVLIK